MENARRRSREWCFRNVIIYSLICCMMLNTSLSTALALEAVDVTGSSGMIGTQWGDHTIIDTAHGAIIDWSNFDTSASQSVKFNQFDGAVLSSASAVLNRITSASATQFDGALSANGRVFIVNPAGIVFGAGSTVNVVQLVASGLNMSDDAFNAVLADPANRMEFEGGDGDVRNFGTINADSVYLIGKNVRNIGTILAPNGLIVLAAGDNVYLAQDGSNVVVEVSDAGDAITDVRNSSRISAEGGSIVLAAGDTFSRAIVNTGLTTAGSGTIRLRAARVENRGTIGANSFQGGDGGSITLSGVEEVVLSGNAPTITADGGANSDGGTITLESSEGSVNLEANSIISATGGSASGDGGYIKITGEHFSIDPSSNIDATPKNFDFEPGTLHIDSPNVLIANGASAGAVDTVYEQDIETLSDKRTSIVISSEQGITVPDIVDGEIKGRYGNIELYGTGTDSFVSFADTTDTISTTLGDIIIAAGSGGLNIGNLETARDLSDANPTPGQIILSTFDGGSITVEDLLIKDGWGHAEINITASGDLTVNGNVVVGGNSPILNIPGGQAAEAMIFLKSGDDMILYGDVTAIAQGSHSGGGGGGDIPAGDGGGGGDIPAGDGDAGVTKAYIGIFTGTNETGTGDLTINGDLTAKAISSSAGTSDATIEIDSWGSLTWGPQAADPLADGDAAQVHVESKQSASDTNDDGDIARIIVHTQGHAAQADGIPDFDTTHMGALVEGNVLENDGRPDGAVLQAALVDGPTHAESFTMDSDGNYSYTPQAGYVGDDTFTYTATVVGEEVPTAPILVTITMTNTPPTPNSDIASTIQEVTIIIDVLANDFDPHGDPLRVTSVTYTGTGSVTINENNTLTYTPGKDFIGRESFSYSATDQIDGTPVTTTVLVTVGPEVTLPPAYFMPTGPDLDKTDMAISGCPALTKWAAKEIGVSGRRMEIWIVNGLASMRGVQPCDACTNLQKAAKILADAEGIHAAAVARIIEEFGSSAGPITEEMAAYITNAMAHDSGTRVHYAIAEEYFRALSEYMGVLHNDMGFSVEKSAQLVAKKYIDPLAGSGNVGVASYLAARLDSVTMFLTVVRLNRGKEMPRSRN